MQMVIASLNESMQKTHEWLNDLYEIGGFQSKEQAYSSLRIILHKLRENLTVDLGAHFTAQLPLILVGIYYEGWNPVAYPKHEHAHSKEEFLEDIEESLDKLSLELSVEQVVRAVYGLLQEKLSPGIISKIQQAMPKELTELWPG